MGYPIVDEAATRAWWREWHQMATASDPSKRCDPPEPPEADTTDLGTEHDWVGIAAAQAADLRHLLSGSADMSAFEAEASMHLHRALPRDRALSDPGFWTWFAVYPGFTLVMDRYLETAKHPLPDVKNFTSPSGKETLFFRLWLRAELAHDPDADDPYELARYGDIDFWRSHVFRQSFNGHRDLLDAFVRFQYPDGPQGPPRLRGKNQAEIRALSKYLRRAFANIDVEMMSRDRAFAFVGAEWQKAEKAMRQAENGA